MFKIVNLDTIESAFFSWLTANRGRILFFFVVYLPILGLSHLPYLNIYFTRVILRMIAIILALFVLKIDNRLIISFAVLLFVPTLLLQLLESVEFAEQLGNFIYMLLTIGVIKSIFEISKD